MEKTLKIIETLPLDEISDYMKCWTKDEIALENAANIKCFIKEKCTFLNIALIEEMIEYCAMDKVAKLIDKYKEQKEKLYKSIQLSKFSEIITPELSSKKGTKVSVIFY